MLTEVKEAFPGHENTVELEVLIGFECLCLEILNFNMNAYFLRCKVVFFPLRKDFYPDHSKYNDSNSQIVFNKNLKCEILI